MLWIDRPRTNQPILALLALFVLLLATTAAHALTAPGTEIKNQATVTYSVGNVPFPAKDSNETSFVVLELIDVAVEWQDAANIAVVAGETGVVTTFRVTSGGNGSETFALAVNAGLLGDDFDPVLVSIHLDSNGNGVFDSGDPLYVAGSNDPVLSPLGEVTVFVVCDIPAGLLSTQHIGRVQLTATSRTGSGNPGTLLAGGGDTGVDAILGLSGGTAAATGAYEANVTDYPLNLTKSGEGRVTSAPAGIDCGNGCGSQSAIYPAGQTVVLTATPAVGQIFAGWGGACAGTNPTCTVVMNQARNVTATFVAENLPVGSIVINNGAPWTVSHDVTLTLGGSDSEGIAAWFVSESATPPAADDPDWQTVTATPTFGADVPFTLSAGTGTKTVYAWYRDTDGNVSLVASDTIDLGSEPPAQVPLTLNKNGEGSVTSNPAGIACGSGCASQSASYDVGQSVLLTAAPAAGHQFAGWSGACTGLNLTCTVSMTQARNVTATFVPQNLPVGSIVINDGAEWTAARNVTLKLTGNDAEGIVGWFVSESATAPTLATPGWNSVPPTAAFTAAVPFTLSEGDGVKTVYAWYRDADGNISPVASDTIKLDTTPPTTSAEPPGGTYPGAVTVNLTCGDGEGIGCAEIRYTTDGSIPTAESPLYTGPLTFYFTTTLNFFAVDKLGNVEAVRTEVYLFEEPEMTLRVPTWQSAAFPYPVGTNVPDANLRNIPGSTHQAIVRVTNKRSDPLENVLFILPIPEEAKFCVDTSKSGNERYVTFAEGTPPSGLRPGSVLFSSDGGLSYGYTPVLDGDSCDPAVTHIKVLPTGSFNGTTGGGDPYLELKFLAQSQSTVPGTALPYTADMSYTIAGHAGTLTAEATIFVAELLDVVTVWQDPAPIVTAPAAKNVVTTFTVTNLGNGSESFALTVDTALAEDDFDPSFASIWLDADGDGRFDPGKDTRYTRGSNDPLLASGAAVTVFVLCDIPNAIDGQRGLVRLTATATTGSGAPAKVIAGKGDGGVDAVVGNSAASSSAIGIYEIASTTVKVLKAVQIVSDTQGNEPPLPLTGSVLRYTLTATVEGSGRAENIVVTDRIPANTHYRPASLALDGAPLSDAADGDAGAFAAGAVTVSLGGMTSAQQKTVSFEVTID